MFLSLEQRKKNEILCVDDRGTKVSCGEFFEAVCSEKEILIPRSIAFLLCDNTASALVSYLSLVECDVVPTMLSSSMNDDLLQSLLCTFKPQYLVCPISRASDFPEFHSVYQWGSYVFLKTGSSQYPIHRDLQLLMTTSGSTGSPKLVRYKKGNLEANAHNVALAFGWTAQERPLCDLAMNYTMGLNVINTHIYVGATIYLTNCNIMQAEYWDFMKEHRLTNLTGVPFSYELFLKLRFMRMELPYMKTLAEGGGKLNDETFEKFASYAAENGKRFVATFGTTETSARMAFLDPQKALEKIGSIGKAIPEGKLWLEDEKGQVIEGNDIEGELCYSGPNVTMGYAQSWDDLLLGDDFSGIYRTGDLARRDAEGYYYIVGRKSRFIKLLGYRVSLDQCEQLLQEHFHIECACTGQDDAMQIYLTDKSLLEEAIFYLSQKTGFYKNLFSSHYLPALPRSDSGKIKYSAL